jgi:hypothetical protein
MIHLLVAVLLVCSSFGAIISKTTTQYGVRKQRQHTEPLKIDKEILS